MAAAPANVLSEWTWQARMRDGAAITLHPLRAGDAECEARFMNGLSEQARLFRPFTPVKSLSSQLLEQLMDVVYDRRVAVVATAGAVTEETFIGIAATESRTGPAARRSASR
jgi:hypothetical protein